MTVHLDYTQLHEAIPHLCLEEFLGGYFSAVDRAGRLHYPPTKDMDKVIRAMRARAIRGHATLDEGSITWFRALRAFGEFSVGVGSLSERVESPLGESVTARLVDAAQVASMPSGPRSESDRKSERGTDGGAGLTAPVSQAATVEREPASPLSTNVVPIRKVV